MLYLVIYKEKKCANKVYVNILNNAKICLLNAGKFSITEILPSLVIHNSARTV